MASAEPRAAPALRLSPRPKYLAITLTALNRAIAYRGTTALNLVSQLIWVGVLYYLWRSVFSARSQLAGFSWDEMRTYIVVSYAANALLSFYSLARISREIRTGDIATDLLRPVDYMLQQLAQTFGAALIEALLSSALALTLGVAFLGIMPPAGPLAAALFFASVWLGFLIKFLISFLVALIAFRILNAIGLIWTQTAIIELLSGALIPLPFFPDWLRTLALLTPFGSIVYTPVAIYLGKLEGAALGRALLFQLVWVVVLWTAARLMWRPSVRALEIQGG